MTAEQTKKVRDSNFELMRIIFMFCIIMTHCIGHGMHDLDYNTSVGVLAAFIIPMGKICFIGFIALSTWFLVGSPFRGRRFLRVWLEVMFYNVIFMLVALWVGGDSSGVGTEEIVFSFFPMFGNAHGFAAAYLVFYLLLPILKTVGDRLTKQQTVMAILVLGFSQFVPIIVRYLTGFSQNFESEIILFGLCFFISIYLHKYPFGWQNNRWLMMAVFIIIWFAIGIFRLIYSRGNHGVLIELINVVFGSEFSLFNIIAGYALFLFFASIKIRPSNIINTIASTPLAVLVIHDHNYFRGVLWDKVLEVNSWACAPFFEFVCRLLLISLTVFAVCAMIDLIRQNTIEKWVMNTKAFDKVSSFLDRISGNE